MLLDRMAVPLLRSVEVVERLVVAVPEVLRLVREFWSTEPVERLVEEPVLRLVRVFWSTVPVERLVVEEEPVLRLVVAEEVPVERFVRSVWVAVPVERLVVEPVLRLVCAEDVLPVERLVVLLPVERLVRSF